MKLMVYGTLKRGYGNNVLLRGASYIGDGFTKKSYVLMNCGFPKAVTKTENENLYPMLPIMGEVFDIDKKHMEACDRLEGHPVWYKRGLIDVWLPSLEREEQVWIYEINDWLAPRQLCDTLVYNNTKYYYWN